MEHEAAGHLPGHPLRVALELLRADAPARIQDDPQSWPRWQVLLPHVLASAAHTNPDTTDAAVLDDTAWLLSGAGTYLRVHARLAEARPLEERALAITETAYGPDHTTVAICLNNLALTLHDMGEPGQARLLLARALMITETAYGPDHPDVANRLNNLAATQRDLDEPGRAQLLLDRAAAIRGNRNLTGPSRIRRLRRDRLAD